ncbi:hypothetical protein GJ496_011790 [Pomphorhynchus laevis]|nr:hypothetical protein GJ496_011790 [Pomphorhynchus laevis]
MIGAHNLGRIRKRQFSYTRSINSYVMRHSRRTTIDWYEEAIWTCRPKGCGNIQINHNFAVYKVICTASIHQGCERIKSTEMVFMARAIFGAKQELTNTELVQTLCERISNARLLQDKLDAYSNLKIATKNLKQEVGNTALPLLCSALLDELQPKEILIYVVDILRILLTIDSSDQEEHSHISINSIMTFTDSFLKREIIERFGELLRDSDYKIRLSSILLISVATQNRPFKSCNLMYSTSICSHITNLIGDAYEAVRNEAILILTLVARNLKIARHIIAFEGGIDKLILVVEKEGGLNSGIITNDCLSLLHILLDNNFNNQKLFLRNQSFGILAPFFKQIDFTTVGTWPELLRNNVLQLLKIIVCIFSENSEFTDINDGESLIKSGITEHICILAFKQNTHINVKIESLSTIACMMQKSKLIQQHLWSVRSEELQSRSFYSCALDYLMIDSDPAVLRLASLYFLSKLISNNESLHTEIDISYLYKSLFECQSSFSRFAILILFTVIVDTNSACLKKKHINTTTGNFKLLNSDICFSDFMSQYKKIIDSSSLISIGFLTLVLHWQISCPAYIETVLSNSLIMNDVVMKFLEDDYNNTPITDDANTRTTQVNSFISESESLPVLKYMCALVIAYCLITVDEHNASHSRFVNLVKKEISIAKCINTITTFTDHNSAIQTSLRSKLPITTISGIQQKHLILDSTSKLIFTIQASLVRSLCEKWDIDSTTWLYSNPILILKPTMKDADTNTIPTASEKSVEDSLQTQLHQAHNDLEQWTQFYNKYVEQQKMSLERYQALASENEALRQLIVKDNSSLQKNVGASFPFNPPNQYWR